jgi:hypothetical protein
MAKSHLWLVAPATVNRTVMPKRRPNAALCRREYLEKATTSSCKRSQSTAKSSCAHLTRRVMSRRNPGTGDPAPRDPRPSQQITALCTSQLAFALRCQLKPRHSRARGFSNPALHAGKVLLTNYKYYRRSLCPNSSYGRYRASRPRV